MVLAKVSNVSIVGDKKKKEAVSFVTRLSVNVHGQEEEGK